MSDSIIDVLQGRVRDLGDGDTVRRVLPIGHRLMVGPFIFFDHMGPWNFTPGRGTDVRPHPHIGLATVTYLFDGAIDHRDSLGSVQTIRPGDLNWMTAGRGIAHSERSPADDRAHGARVHGIQAWVALPTDAEECEPRFEHYPGSALPQRDADGARIRVIAGSAYGLESPARVASPTFYVEAKLDAGARLSMPGGHPERALYVVSGAVDIDGRRFGEGDMPIFAADADVTLHATSDAHLMLLGGAPLGTRKIWWNFVSSRAERIEQAKADWKAGRFDKVPCETEFIPLPEPH
ncbi:pirin family protein [Solimonas marina]|uniref:Pirin family protein n=1 Tax=Solimonas marina TaxID=2714601 RepID=A0A970B7V9_9GAMM|nr:pirin family protein [Solimonas marina]NKF20811.1 pirin family protein [Solimonas marina]